jgi:hypothetical protein
MTSFYNAGSGTNQSNHLYKLGPVHQGILERGSKTGSFSYLLWPSRVGAFSVVMGKHYQNFDTTNLPFSYVNEEGGKSAIIPAMNYFTVGTFRDGAKWPRRDRRKHADKLDQIHFEVLSPYTVQRMIAGYKELKQLYADTPRGQDAVNYNGIQLKRLLMKTCSRYYAMIIDKYCGDVIAQRILNEKDWRKATDSDASGPWVDVSGLICRQGRLNAALAEEYSDQSQLLQAFQELHAAYADDEWNWVLEAFPQVYDQELGSMSNTELLAFFEKWQSSSGKLLNMVIMDAQKEFDEVIQTGFGIDGERVADFTAVRGEYADNSFVADIQDQVRELDQLMSKLKQKLG